MRTAQPSGSTEWPTLARWRALLGLIWRAGRWRAVLVGVLVLVIAVLPAPIILVTGELIDAVPAAARDGLDSPDGRRALVALALVIAGTLVGVVLRSIQTYLARVLDTFFGLELHQTVAAAALGTSGVAPLEDPAVSDDLMAIEDAEKRGLLRMTVTELCSVATMRINGIAMAVVLLGFAWWAPVPLIAAWMVTNLVYRRTTEAGVTVSMTEGAVRIRRAEYLRSIALDPAAAKELRVFGLGGWVVGQYGAGWLDALQVMWKARKANRALNAGALLGLVVSHAVVLGALGIAASRGEIGVAALFVFVQAAMGLNALGLIGDPQWRLARALGVTERVMDLKRRLAAAPEVVEAQARPRAAGPMPVRLEGVRFTYRGREKPTLDGLDLTIPPGQSLAIVGENGVGKSTLIKLLCGLYEPDAGRIVLDANASAAQARSRVGVIFQDFIRYPLTLRENVGFGDLSAAEDREMLEGALKDAGGAELLAALSEGWDTVLSRAYAGGAELSGGQWQRVALARALTAVRGGAGLLILDEPTANLDVRAETELFERFLDLTRDVTTILVSHRLSSVRRADRIVVIHGGRVVEDGNHQELMMLGGRYARMFALQAERFTTPTATMSGVVAAEVQDA